MSATYQAWGAGRRQSLATFALMAAVGALGLVSSLAGSHPPLWFVAIYLLALIWNAYRFLLRIAYRLELHDN